MKAQILHPEPSDPWTQHVKEDDNRWEWLPYYRCLRQVGQCELCPHAFGRALQSSL